MTDDEVLAYYRDRHPNPYMMMGTALALYGLELKHWPALQAM